jgi:hypothetical protein
MHGLVGRITDKRADVQAGKKTYRRTGNAQARRQRDVSRQTYRQQEDQHGNRQADIRAGGSDTDKQAGGRQTDTEVLVVQTVLIFPLSMAQGPKPLNHICPSEPSRLQGETPRLRGEPQLLEDQPP